MQAYRALWELPRALWVLAAANFVNRFGAMVLVFLAVYFVKVIGPEFTGCRSPGGSLQLGRSACGSFVGLSMSPAIRLVGIGSFLSYLRLLVIALPRGQDAILVGTSHSGARLHHRGGTAGRLYLYRTAGSRRQAATGLHLASLGHQPWHEASVRLWVDFWRPSTTATSFGLTEPPRCWQLWC